MKKFAMAAVAAAALSAGVAQAYTVGTFSNGFVVPNVIHNDAADTTAVGLINQSGAARAVYWTFFDQNSNHVTDGCVNLTNKDYESFIWSGRAGAGLAGKRGYLVFAAGATTAGTAQTACAGSAVLASVADTQISGTAFHVYATSKDVAFVPVIDGPLTLQQAGVAASTGVGVGGVVNNGTQGGATNSVDITTMGSASLLAVAGAVTVAGATALPQPQFSMRYAIDGATGGLDTAIVVWSTGDHKGSHTVNMYDDKQDRKSVNFDLKFAELDWFDPESIVGRAANHLDGFIEWTPGASIPAGAPATGSLYTLGGSVFTYSVISSASFGAVQTVLGAHR